MTTQYTAPLVSVQQQLLDTAKSQLALVRVAVEKANNAVFDATQEYLELVQADLALVSGDTVPGISDVVARGYERSAQVLALQEKVLRGLSEAWTPVVEKAASDATTWADSTRKPVASSTTKAKAA
jgi:hypothetical protein